MGRITAATVCGLRPKQEDRLVVLPREDGYLLAVCDGHGGYRTATTAIAQLVEFCMNHAQRRSAYDEVNAEIFLRALVRQIVDKTQNDISGSTLSIAYISEEASRVSVAVLGDSPVVVRLGGQMSSVWVSPEHNVRSNEGDCHYVREHGGEIEGSYLYADPHGGGLQLTRALGDRKFASVLQREAQYFSFSFSGKHNLVAVMSDGVYDAHTMCTKEDLMIQQPITNAGQLVADALLRGSRDNVSAIVWRF